MKYYLVVACSICLFMLSCFFTGCKKKDVTESSPPENNDLFEILSVYANSTEKLTFIYSNNQSVRVVDTTWSNQDSTNKQFFYSVDIELNLQKQPVKITHTNYQHNVDEIIHFDKAANHSLVVSYEFPNSNLTSPEHWLGFDANGRIAVDSSYDVIRKVVYYVDSLEYDSNDNIIKFQRFTDIGSGGFYNEFMEEYTYDQKDNPFYSQRSLFNFTKITPDLIYFGKNNLLTETFIDTTSNIKQISKTFTYTYNSKGLPTKRTLKTPAYSNAYAYNVEYRYR